MDGKVWLVTGGSRGIGRSIVWKAAEAGAKVAFCCRHIDEACDALLREADGRFGAGRVKAFAADVGEEADVERLFDSVLDTFGSVDVAVNNAGINRDHLLVHTSLEDFAAVIRTNLTGAFLVCRRAVQEFVGQDGGGKIVSIGSLSQMGATSQASYSASKGGLWGLTRTIAKEYGSSGVYANLVVVGFVDTQLSEKMPDFARKFLIDHCPLRRLASPEEVASAVLFLGSDRSSFVNGEALHVSGGLTDVPL